MSEYTIAAWLTCAACGSTKFQQNSRIVGKNVMEYTCLCGHKVKIHNTSVGSPSLVVLLTPHDEVLEEE